MAEYIEREAVLSKLLEYGIGWGAAKVKGVIQSIPAADVAPVRRGRWKGEHKRGSFSHPDSITYECSECGYAVYTIYGFPHLPNYCPNCGARLEADE